MQQQQLLLPAQAAPVTHPFFWPKIKQWMGRDAHLGMEYGTGTSPELKWDLVRNFGSPWAQAAAEPTAARVCVYMHCPF